MDNDIVILFSYQPNDSLHKKLLGLLPEPLHNWDLDILIRLQTIAL